MCITTAIRQLFNIDWKSFDNDARSVRFGFQKLLLLGYPMTKRCDSCHIGKRRSALPCNRTTCIGVTVQVIISSTAKGAFTNSRKQLTCNSGAGITGVRKRFTSPTVRGKLDPSDPHGFSAAHRKIRIALGSDVRVTDTRITGTFSETSNAYRSNPHDMCENGLKGAAWRRFNNL